ncbi:IS66 family transposase [Nitrincola nitratireducens]
MAGPGLLAYVATQKYCDALPLYRQSEIFKRAKVSNERVIQITFKCHVVV